MGDTDLGVVNAAGGMATGIVNNIIGAARQNAQNKWTEKMVKEQRDWDLNMWNMTNQYNDPANQVARMERAGLNTLNFGLDGNSTQAMGAASPISPGTYGPQAIENPVGTYMQTKLQEKQMELMNSEIDKNKEGTEGTRLDNEFKQRTMDARVQSEDLKNNISKEQVEEIRAHKEEMMQHVAKMIEEEKSERVKQALLEAQTKLRNAEANQIAELLPYHKLLMDAQTDAQKATAAAQWMSTAYNAKLIGAGYIEAITDQAKSVAKNNSEIAAINKFAADCKNGTMYSYNGKAWNDVPAYLMNGVVHAISTLSQAIGGGLGGVISATAK